MKKCLYAVPFVLLLCLPMACRDETAKAKTTIRMEEMNWPDIKTAIESGFKTVVIAVGSTEQHGPHLPTLTDARIGEDVAERVARKLGHALQARTIDVGLSEHHLAFAGTTSLRPETLLLILRDYTASLAHHGFTRIVYIPLHGGNFETVRQAVEEARQAHPGIDVTGFTDLQGMLDLLKRNAADYGISAVAAGGHAGESETSMMMALEGRLVAADRFAPGYLGPFGEAERKLMFEKGIPALSANGILGDPRTASAEKGEVYLERLADFVVSKIGTKTTD
jgi:creatinine amidohydrolase